MHVVLVSCSPAPVLPGVVTHLVTRGHTVQPWTRPAAGLVGMAQDVVVLVDGREAVGAARRFCADLVRIGFDAPVVLALRSTDLDRLGTEWPLREVAAVADLVLDTASAVEWERRLTWAADRVRRRRVDVSRVTLGDLVLDSDSFTLSTPERVIALTSAEHRLLDVLFRNPDVVFTREQLRGSGAAGGDQGRQVDTFVCRLRRKLGPSGAVLQTVRGVGYRISAPQTLQQRVA